MKNVVNSVLIGNGLDIQVGGDDYQNKWILVRLLAKAKMGKYDELFTNKGEESPITGDEIVELFHNLIPYGNKALHEYFDDMVNDYKDEDVINALSDFKNSHETDITSIEDIGMEDWILIFCLYLIEQRDLLDSYEAVKQGIERMILDAIYCEGNVNSLYLKMNEASKSYFNSFDNIFTLNYDITIEELTHHPVFHLHGDFKTKMPSEDPGNAQGYTRIKNKENVWFPPQLSHCNRSAILDFSGNRKYKFANNMTNLFYYMEDIKDKIKQKDYNIEELLEHTPDNCREFVVNGIKNNLIFGHDYHFKDIEKLSGILKIIGLAPQNDSHIFSCINKSNIEKVVFYHYFGEKSDDEVVEEIKNINLPINKPYIIENVKKVWYEIKLSKPINSTTYTQILLNRRRNDFLNIFNSFYVGATVSMEDILWQLKSIPVATERIICEMMNSEISKSMYHTTPESEKELFQHFIDFGKTLKIAAISPQALYFLYIISSKSNSKKSKSARGKQKR